ncbi:efflux RND transporter periplasmic adaptor subunit [Vibrio sp. F74]|uniref:efflux RND transporter periplasmic adaptor subunit n=1 Tax=Vibrio sp. F74 TaxID=700020 RepID=UPI0035F5BC68
MKKSKILLGLALFFILGLLFLYMAGFFTTKLPEQGLRHSADYPQIESVAIVSQSMPISYEFTGTVAADQKAIISARLTAKVAEVLVNVGSVVKQGDVLMRLESRDLDARVKQTEQALSSAQAILNAARKEYRRVKELVSKKLLSQSQFDKTESDLKTAQASFKQAEAAVVEAETTFGFSMITAPFDGLITQKNVNMGDTASPGMQLLSMYNPEKLQLQVNISEAQIRDVHLGSSLAYHLPTYDIEGKGDVVEISPAADNSSRSFVVKLEMDTTSLVYPGVYGKVVLSSGEQSVLILPENTVYQVGQLDYVKVIQEGVIHNRLVQLGDHNQVRKGVSSGDNLVVDPLNYK